MVRGADETSGLSLQPPVYAATQAPTPSMSALDKMGLGATMQGSHLNAGGYVEAGWTYNFDTPDSHTNVGRVFDFEDQDPTFHQLGLYIEKTLTSERFDFGGRIEWIWGGDARGIHANGVFDHYGFPIFPGASPGQTGDGPDEQFDPVQFYITTNFPIGEGIVSTFGKFVTPFGYETINPTTNPLYSHSYLFGFAIPFTNFGSKYSYSFNKSLGVMVGYVRGWDQAFEDNNDQYSFMGQVTYTSDKLDLTVGAITGPEQFDDNSDYRTVIDGILVYRASDQLQLVLNGDFGWEASAAVDGGSAQWCGLAGYAMYKVTEQLTLVGRAEYFNDGDGARGLGTTVYEMTAGLNIKPMPNHEYLSGLVIRPELRWDHANNDIFNDGNDDNQYTFGIDAVYSF
jgi:hypothetical protein